MNKTTNSKLNSIQSRETPEQEINVEIKELILTPLTCASIINEIIKCLLYQKSQIPYPHIWLKSVANRKLKESEEQGKPVNLTVERHYRVVSRAYDALEELMKNLNREFKNCAGNIQQVVILFGSTVYSPKEVYRIKVSSLAMGHSEDTHLRVNSKNQYKILKNIVLADEWTSAMEKAIPPTNMYVMLQKNYRNDRDTEEDFFVPNQQYSLPTRVKNVVINLNYNDNTKYNCCDNLSIFEDLFKEKTDIIKPSECTEGDNCTKSIPHCVHNDSSCDLFWFQAKIVLQGFKECFINNVSATELW